jgi:hypothetical protein
MNKHFIIFISLIGVILIIIGSIINSYDVVTKTTTVSHTNQNEFEAEARYGSLECHIQG